MLFKSIFLLFFSILSFRCFLFFDSGENRIQSINQKYFLGRSNTANFQNSCEELLQYYGYYIDSYENDQVSSKVITKWNVREPNESERTLGFLEAKTKLIIEGEIISNTYTKNNGYDYNTFLIYQNVGYKNNGYVFINDTPAFQKHLEVMVTHFREKFNFNK